MAASRLHQHNYLNKERFSSLQNNMHRRTPEEDGDAVRPWTSAPWPRQHTTEQNGGWGMQESLWERCFLSPLVLRGGLSETTHWARTISFGLQGYPTSTTKWNKETKPHMQLLYFPSLLGRNGWMKPKCYALLGTFTRMSFKDDSRDPVSMFASVWPQSQFTVMQQLLP